MRAMQSETSCAACAKLIRQCAGLDFFPADTEVRRLLIDRAVKTSRRERSSTGVSRGSSRRRRLGFGPG